MSLKFEEIHNPESCLNKARLDEMIFVLRATDPAAPATIQFWMDQRIQLGLNQADDVKLRRARHAMEAMIRQRDIQTP